MGIERNDRTPKRRRTTAHRMRGRMKHVYELPKEGPAAEKPAKKAAAKPAAKKAAAKKAPAKKAAAKNQE